MKNFGIAVVAFISVQTIHAILTILLPNINKCEKDLSNLRNDAAKFFTEFGNEHKFAQKDLEEIQDSIGMLGNALDSFASINYGADDDLNNLQCYLKKFIDTASVQRLETDKTIIDLQDECNILQDMVDDFNFSHNLICRWVKLSGCDAELNQLRCELSEFFDELDEAASRAGIYLRGLKNACYNLGTVEKKFRKEYELTCDQDEDGAIQPQEHTCECKKGNINNLKRDAKRYYSETRRPYDAGRVHANNLTGICNHFSDIIASWNTKLSC